MVSPKDSDSGSRKSIQSLSARIEAGFPEAKIVQRDLAKDKIPDMDYSSLKAVSSKDPVEAPANKESARLSDQLTDELLASDLLVIATPMWNFGIPSLLKAWIDFVVRAGRTFNYTKNGVIGLAKIKKRSWCWLRAVCSLTGLGKPWDFVEPYLRAVLGFIGIV